MVTDATNCPHCDGSTPVFFTDGKDNDRFYESINGGSVHTACPIGTALLASLLAVCVLVAVVSAAPTCPQYDGSTPVFFPDENDSSSFYECSNGRSVHMACPTGTVWNSNINTCDWPQSRK
ncbi:peritrophin-1-like [Schistocerca americana]|uniref:peritrophin-1-like n=1 Tax=Schistocerca americana TaxID=7009 RepID=UPI001F4F44F1|nr:peritrophin-1-like [Schistocerca americana]